MPKPNTQERLKNAESEDVLKMDLVEIPEATHQIKVQKSPSQDRISE